MSTLLVPIFRLVAAEGMGMNRELNRAPASVALRPASGVVALWSCHAHSQTHDPTGQSVFCVEMCPCFCTAS